MAAEVALSAPSPMASWLTRRTRPAPTAPVRRYSRDELLALSAKAAFPSAVLRSAPEVLACTPVAAILSTPSAAILATTPLSTPGTPSSTLSLSSPLLRSNKRSSPASPSSPLSVSSPSSTVTTPSGKQRNVETDEHRLAQRVKQIEYGKRTQGYVNYIAQVPRKQRGASDPRTPDTTQRCSKRAWDGQVRKWRRLLHAFDDAGSDSSGAEPCTVDSAESGDESDELASLSASSSSVTPMDDTPLAARLEQLSLAAMPAELAAH